MAVTVPDVLCLAAVDPKYHSAAVAHFRRPDPLDTVVFDAARGGDHLLAFAARCLRAHARLSPAQTLLTASDQLAVLEKCSLEAAAGPLAPYPWHPLAMAPADAAAWFATLVAARDALEAAALGHPAPPTAPALAAAYAAEKRRSNLVDPADVAGLLAQLAADRPDDWDACTALDGPPGARYVFVDLPAADPVARALCAVLLRRSHGRVGVVAVAPFLSAAHYGDAFHLFTVQPVPLADVPAAVACVPPLPAARTFGCNQGTPTQPWRAGDAASPAGEPLRADPCDMAAEDDLLGLAALCSGEFPGSLSPGIASVAVATAKSGMQATPAIFSACAPADKEDGADCADPRVREPNCFISPGSAARPSPLPALSPRNGAGDLRATLYERHALRLALCLLDLVLNTRHDAAMVRLLAGGVPAVPADAVLPPHPRTPGPAAPASVYQHTLSYVRRLQLGGAGYQDSETPLEAHRAALRAVHATFERLQTCLLEDLAAAPAPAVDAAGFRRLLRPVARAMLGAEFDRVDAPSWHAAQARLLACFDHVTAHVLARPHAPAALRAWPVVLRLVIDLAAAQGGFGTRHMWTSAAWFGDRPFTPSLAHAFGVPPPPTPPAGANALASPSLLGPAPFTCLRPLFSAESPTSPLWPCQRLGSGGPVARPMRRDTDPEGAGDEDLPPPLRPPSPLAPHLMAPAVPLSPVKAPPRKRRPRQGGDDDDDDDDSGVGGKRGKTKRGPQIVARTAHAPAAAAPVIPRRKAIPLLAGQKTLAAWLTKPTTPGV